MALQDYGAYKKAVEIALAALNNANRTGNNDNMQAYAKVAEAAALLANATKG